MNDVFLFFNYFLIVFNTDFVWDMENERSALHGYTFNMYRSILSFNQLFGDG